MSLLAVIIFLTVACVGEAGALSNGQQIATGAQITNVFADSGDPEQSDITNGMVLWWKTFTGSSANDSTGNGNSGTLLNSPTVSTGPNGGQALVLNGSNQYIKSAVDLSAITNSTASIWFKLNANTTGYLFAYNDSGSIYLSANYNISSGIFAGRKLSASSIAYSFDTVWHQLAWTWDGSVLSIYLDGEIKTQGSNAALNTNNSEFQVGARNDSAQNFINATIADVRIYNRALSSSEIATLYSNGAK